MRILLTAIVLLVPAAAVAGDWPTHRADATRSGVTSETLAFPLNEIWRHAADQPPRPAWPPPARSSYWQNLAHIEPRVTDDSVFQPIVSDDAVYFASSADDQVHCLDLRTGERRWRFFTEGPVRFAPTLAGDRLFVGSDDGCVYALDARTGRLIWKHRVGPGDRRIPGNGRIISMWPVRTGLIVDDGVVYAMAGLFPSQDVYACALRAADGTPIWKHELPGHSPQGYLLASPDKLYIPTGRANPISLDRATGQQVQSYDGVGGTFALLMDDVIVAGRGNDGSLAASDVASRERIINFSGRQMVVTADRAYLQSATHLLALDRKRHVALVRRSNAIKKRIDALNKRLNGRNDEATRPLREQLVELARQHDELQKQIAACERWKIDNPHHDAMILADDAVIVGGDGVVKAFDANTGVERWAGKVEGKAQGLAVANEHLIVATDRGVIHAFSWGEKVILPLRAPLALDDPRAAAILNASKIAKGYCLVVGADQARLAHAIAAQTDLVVVVIDRDAERVADARELLAVAKSYGEVSVMHVPGDALPFTDYFANLVITGKDAAWPEAELDRVLRPSGGVLWRDGVVKTRGPLDGAAAWDHMYGSTANTSFSSDSHIQPKLQLQWFGGPGPRTMIDRHLRGPAPLAVNGKLFIFGDNAIIAVDAYNGTTLWDIELPQSQRYSMPYDAGYATADDQNLMIAVNEEAWIIDVNTGEKSKTIRVPRGEREGEKHWGYMAIANHCLVGTAQKPTASRTAPSRDMIDRDYRSGQGLVTSDAIFRLDPADGQTFWTHQRGAIINPTITMADGKLYFMESRNAEAVNHDTGRIPLDTLAQQDLMLVCIEVATGETLFERAIDLTACRNIVYLAHADDKLIISGTRDLDDKKATYIVRVLNAANGEEIWATEHPGRAGDLYHGEQVQHPVVMGDILVSEPMLFELATGKPINPEGGDGVWTFTRPGHSCGTMTAAGSQLFFRATNPTMLDLSDAAKPGQRFTRLSPTRTGCWINVIPAQGLVLIPEASAGCVCHFSLQTSMAFLPVTPHE